MSFFRIDFYRRKKSNVELIIEMVVYVIGFVLTIFNLVYMGFSKTMLALAFVFVFCFIVMLRRLLKNQRDADEFSKRYDALMGTDEISDIDEDEELLNTLFEFEDEDR